MPMKRQVKNAIRKWSIVIVTMILAEYLCHFVFNLGLMSVSAFIYSCIGVFALIILTMLFKLSASFGIKKVDSQN